MRAVLFLVRLALKLFYRRIVYVGLDHVPASGPVLFVLNHPNALVDPLFVLDAVRRPVHFLAKAPLLRAPLFGRLLHAVGTLPVFRGQDGADPRQNAETFLRCHQVLALGEAVAIFPEGTTHSDAVLRPVKTGAARIALGAEAMASFTLGVRIIPVGLQYRSKQTFRSNVTVWFGEGHTVDDLAARYGEAPADAVHDETRRLGVALHDVTVNLDRQETLALMAAMDIFTAGETWREDEVVALRRQFQEGYAWLSVAVPARIARLRRALDRYARMLLRLGITARDLSPGQDPSATGLGLRALAALPLLILAAAGVALEWVPYNVVDAIARRTDRREPEMTATTKLVAAVVLFPLWWVVTAAVLWWAVALWPAVALLGAHPVVAYLGMTALERLDRLKARVQVFRLGVRPIRLERLRRHQRAIREELQTLAGVYTQRGSVTQ
jgi:1-acyl-sn-glycerol-3-phosphate acyltransferase